MSDVFKAVTAFVEYAETLDGDEKGEAQVFCDRLFQGFGHKGYKEAGATLEFRVPKASGKGKSFADLVWKPKLLIEMKRKGENLAKHYRQAFDYWLNAVPNRPRYVVLCNFTEFWIYDFDKQLDEPVDIVQLAELPKRYTALNFLFPGNKKPLFANDREAVSRKTAADMADLFKRLVAYPGNTVSKEQAQRFVLQCVVAMFAEDIDLLPAGTMKTLVDACLEAGDSSYDLIGGLFAQMNNPTPAKFGRYKGVRYFNGGLFSVNEPIELGTEELQLLGGETGAATEDWSKVNPAIFGTLFQSIMDAKERHKGGKHFTSEADIQRVVGPTLLHPWMRRVNSATTAKELLALRKELVSFKVLDPACGSGNFLYVAFRELARVDIAILSRLREEFPKIYAQEKNVSGVSPQQFYGFDNDSFAVELAKVTLMLAKKLAMDEARETLGKAQGELIFAEADALPLDNLNANIVKADALFTDWPAVDAIIGNPPFQSKNKAAREFGRAYWNRVRAAYGEIPGRADYCVYWFRKAHDHLKLGQRAGLVGTNTIKQTFSRIGGLDHIVTNGGTITEAVGSQVWSGDAAVHVSIVNWIKGEQPGTKKLYWQAGDRKDSPWHIKELAVINSSLSDKVDVSGAFDLTANKRPKACFQGQTHGNDGFLLPNDEAASFITKNAASAELLHPYLIADDLLGSSDGRPKRHVIDFGQRTIYAAQGYKELYKRVETVVLPDRQEAAKEEAKQNAEALAEDPKAKTANDHANALEHWWQLFRRRKQMLERVANLPRYIACARVTKRPIFAFIDTNVRPNDALTVFPFADDYSFGVLQSDLHWRWFVARCSTLKGDWRYTSTTVFDTFPWPQKPSLTKVQAVASAAVRLREVRAELQDEHGLSLRELYRGLDLPGNNPLRTAQDQLDAAVRACYGLGKGDPLAFLLALNETVADAEKKGDPVQKPGLPAIVKNPSPFITTDCVRY